MEEKRWLCFFHPVHILWYSEEENGGDWNSFMFLKHNNNSEYNLKNKNKNPTCTNDGQDPLTVHAHSIYVEDVAQGDCF